jgi:hypothetical protein
MAAFTKVNAFVADVANGFHDIANDTIKIALFSSDPTASATSYSGLSGELSGLGGYTTGGITIGNKTSSQTSGTYTFDSSDSPTWTSSGSPMGGTSFRYVVIYNSTSDKVIGYYDYGSTVSLTSGNQFAVTFDASGILTIA